LSYFLAERPALLNSALGHMRIFFTAEDDEGNPLSDAIVQAQITEPDLLWIENTDMNGKAIMEIDIGELTKVRCLVYCNEARQGWLEVEDGEHVLLR